MRGSTFSERLVVSYAISGGTALGRLLIYRNSAIQLTAPISFGGSDALDFPLPVDGFDGLGSRQFPSHTGAPRTLFSPFASFST